MARKRQSDIASFLQQVQSTKQTLPKMESPYTNIQEQTAKAQQNVIQGTQKKAEETAKATTEANINKSAGLQYDTSSYAPVKAEAPTTTTKQGNIEGLADESTYTSRANTAAVDYANKRNEAVANMGEVRQTFLTGGIEEAKKKYKDLFGSEMPAKIQSQFGANYQSILDFLKAPSAAEGQFRQLSDIERQAKQAGQAGVDIESAYSTLGGLKGSDAALDIQSNLGVLQNIVGQNEYQKQAETARQLQQQSAIQNLLESISKGKENVEKAKTSAKEQTEKEKVDASEIEKGLLSDYANEKNAAVKHLKNALGIISEGTGYDKIKEYQNLLEKHKDKLSDKDYKYYSKKINDTLSGLEKKAASATAKNTTGILGGPIAEYLNPQLAPQGIPTIGDLGLGNINWGDLNIGNIGQQEDEENKNATTYRNWGLPGSW